MCKCGRVGTGENLAAREELDLMTRPTQADLDALVHALANAGAAPPGQQEPAKSEVVGASCPDLPRQSSN